MASAPFFRAKGGEVPRRGMLHLRVGFFSHVRERACPRPGGSAFFEDGQRDFGVSSKANKFACDLRALLASDKHLESAERSESEVRSKLRKMKRQRVPEALWQMSERFAEAAELRGGPPSVRKFVKVFQIIIFHGV